LGHAAVLIHDAASGDRQAIEVVIATIERRQPNIIRLP
jgi:hypothetical protein